MFAGSILTGPACQKLLHLAFVDSPPLRGDVCKGREAQQLGLSVRSAFFFFLPACTRLSDVVRERGGCSTNRKGGSRWPSTVSSIRGASVCESHSSSPSAAPASISPRNVHKWAAAMNNVSFIISAAARLLFFFSRN